MAANNFIPFAAGSGANVISQADYEALVALASGFQSGKASSAQINKVLRQSSFIAAALAQYVANKSGQDVLDDGDLNGFIAKLVSGLGKDFMGTGAFGLGIRNEKLPGTMAGVDVSRFDYFAPKDNIGPLPGTWCGGITHAMGDQIGWQIAGLGQGAPGGSPRAFIRMMLSNKNFSNWGELYHTLNKPSATDVGALPADDPRISGALQAKNNLADVQSATASRANLGLGSAATSNVGTGSGQIPNMNSFTSGSGSNGWWRRGPDGIIEQYGTISNMSSTGITPSFPIAFPSEMRSFTVGVTGIAGANNYPIITIALTPATGTKLTHFTATGYNTSTSGVTQLSNVIFYYHAIGV